MFSAGLRLTGGEAGGFSFDFGWMMARTRPPPPFGVAVLGPPVTWKNSERAS
ncbi:hypothetical protein D3C83_86530 [compost metagenome]